MIISRDVIFEEDEKWTWSTQGENLHSLTFLPDFLSDQTQVDEVDQSDEEMEVSTPNIEMTSSPSISGGSQSPRYRSLSDLYSETTPITQDEQACLLSSEELVFYSKAAQEEVWR